MRSGNSMACDFQSILLLHTLLYCCSHDMQLICVAKHLFSISRRSISRNLVQCSLLLSHVSVETVSPAEMEHPADFPPPEGHTPAAIPLQVPHCMMEHTHTIKLFLQSNSFFKLLNFIQMCILFVTPFILFP